MRGRKPKPLERQISEGDPRKKGSGKLKEQLANQPLATRGLPGCPEHLGDFAKSAWQFWAEELADMKLAFRPDAMMLEGACVGYERAVEADLMIQDDGAVIEEPVTDKEGNIVEHKLKAHPAVAISKEAWKQVRAFCSEFGLSPVSRTRLAIEKTNDPGEELAEILSRPRQPRQPVN